MGDSHRVHYVRDPFRREPDFGVTSVNYDLAELLARARRDAPAITASSRRRRVSKEQGFGIDRLPRINALRFAHSRKVENPRFNSAETSSNMSNAASGPERCRLAMRFPGGDPLNVRAGDTNVGQFTIGQVREFAPHRLVPPPGLI